MVKHLSTMREIQVRSLGQEDTLEKEMAIHSSTIAWKIPWTEEPDRLQSVGSQSRTQLSDFTHSLMLIFIYWLHPCGTCIPSSPIRDQTCAPCTGRMES